jgi:hypothetical protein
LETQDFDSETRELLGLDNIGEIGGDLTIDSDGADDPRGADASQVESLDASDIGTETDTESN